MFVSCDIWRIFAFFEVNTKYISSSELKTSKFSRVRSMSETFDVFNSRDTKYISSRKLKTSEFSRIFTGRQVDRLTGRRVDRSTG